MTLPSDLSRRRFLPLASGPHGSRSNRTCQLRCGNACDHPQPNTSTATPIGDIIESAIARRSVLKGAAAGALALGFTGLGATTAGAAPSARRLTFDPVRPNNRDALVVPDGYRKSVIVKWGDPVMPGAPEFDVRFQTARRQEVQFGYNCDYTTVMPLSDPDRALLVVNHEYTDEYLMFPEGEYTPQQIRRISMMAHGMSVLTIRRVGDTGEWELTPPTRRNRRITVDTPMTMSGPARHDPRIGGAFARGTLNNCAGGVTPWGTVLSGEENFNQYFDRSGGAPARFQESYRRYGLPTEPVTQSRNWSAEDPRFDITREPTEPFKFGWIVELDPYRPGLRPKKRTMLGRFKHEGATIAVAPGGKIVAYMGDDERGDYVYKFISRDAYDPDNRDANVDLLDHGTLYVARFTGDGTEDGVYDGTVRWIPLTSDTESYVPGFSVADVLIDTRLAADTVGSTPMDRPEDIQPNPVNGRVYLALTNNTLRGTGATNLGGKPMPVNEANPIRGNKHGYVMEILEGGRDQTSLTGTWNLLIVCGDPDNPKTYFAGFPKDKVSPISSPDNVTFDRYGHLWIGTDGNDLGFNDGLYAVPVDGDQRGHLKQFLTVPIGAESTGPTVTEDQRTVIVAVQHPGETDEATFENPSSTWPHTDPFPRPGVAAVWRGDGRRVGA